MSKPRPEILLAAAAALLLAFLPGSSSAEPAHDAWSGMKPRVFSIGDVVEILLSGEGPVIVDSRSRKEYAAGHVPGALNVPHKETWGRIEEFERYRDRGIIFYCRKGSRAAISSEGLITEGFEKVGVMFGHFEAWERGRLPVEP